MRLPVPFAALAATVAFATAAYAQAGQMIEPDAAPGTDPAMTQAAAPEATPALPDTSMFEAKRTVFDNLKISPDLSTFEAALRQTNLARLLGNPGPYTVFAPTNAAFARLPDGALAGLSRKQLTHLLGYHIVPGKLGTTRLAKLVASGHGTATLSTVDGGHLYVTRDGASFVLKDGAGDTATIVAADVNSSNGMLHLVDGVLQPSK
jgi:uncharacterized surface protein with fasciclin (FAS1) repeats